MLQSAYFNPFAWKGLSVVLYQQGKIFEALRPMQEVVRLSPEDAEAHSNLGSLFNHIGNKQEAETFLRRAVELRPDFAEGHFNLGNVLKDLGRPHEAEQCYREALHIKPDFVDALCNLGVVLKMTLQPVEAEPFLRSALDLSPGFAEAHFNLGNVLHDQGRLEEAVVSFREAVRLKRDDYPEALSNLGVSLRVLGHYQDAEESLRESLRLMPGNAEVRSNLGVILNELGRSDESESYFREAIRSIPGSTAIRSNLLFLLSASQHHAPDSYLDEARQFGQIVTQMAKRRFDHDAPNPAPGRLRVGFVSGDLRNHPVGFFIEGLANAIDPTRIELLAFPTNLLLDELSERLIPVFTKWQPIFGLEDEVAAKLIHGAGVDILIDLSGHTEHNRLPVFAYKSAPVQISWLGFWASTGVEEMDYLLGDPVVTPPADESCFVEHIWRLPETRFCYTPPSTEVTVREAPVSRHGHVTFGSFNKLNKLTDRVMSVWARILEQVPDARLFLKAKQLDDADVRKGVEARFQHFGIAPERLILRGVTSRFEYLADFNQIDIALDPFPFPGGTTSADALWMGVPVLTLQGDSLISRQGEGIVRSANLSDWIATDEDDYVHKAVNFAQDHQALIQVKQSLRERVMTSPLFDTQRFARNFENAMGSIWGDYCRKAGLVASDAPKLDFSKLVSPSA